MSEQKLVSILLPIFNVENYIIETLVSIEEQSYSNIETIIIDDGSSDNSYQVVFNYIKNKPNFKLYRNIENQGISKTLNKALVLSNGYYIARVDGDDLLDCNRIYKQVEKVEHSNIDIIGCSLYTIDESSRKIGGIKYTSNSNSIEKLLTFTSPISHIWLCKKEIYNNVGEYKYDGAEDLFFIQRAHKLGYKISNLDNYYGMYIRIRSGNTNSLQGLKQRFLHKHVLNQVKKNTEEPFIYKEKPFREFTYKLSCNLIKKGLSKSLYIKVIYYLISISISYDQFIYLMDRLKKKRLLNK
ncbi:MULTISPECIES: glycosyltransferase [unclassified Proteus (in: enterobacteria)]|uniref:glycosyltransferase n=1 Tax=unclassified Proteus (in: enterobacteria) TaxID=257482 RepID=UPI0013778410|nr:glycosyltransferase [Proteus sp. G2662]NBN24107.1 glycosyltransferase [Proteus sp. G2657]